MLEALKSIEISPIEELTEVRQQSAVLKERVARLEEQRSEKKISEPVFERIGLDYGSQIKALEERAEPLQASARQQYARLRQLLDQVERALGAGRLDREELEVRHQLGEFDAGQYEQRLAEVDKKLGRRQTEMDEIHQVRQRFLAAFDSEEDLEAMARDHIEQAPSSSQDPDSQPAAKKPTAGSDRQKPPASEPQASKPPTAPPAPKQSQAATDDSSAAKGNAAATPPAESTAPPKAQASSQPPLPPQAPPPPASPAASAAELPPAGPDKGSDSRLSGDREPSKEAAPKPPQAKLPETKASEAKAPEAPPVTPPPPQAPVVTPKPAPGSADTLPPRLQTGVTVLLSQDEHPHSESELDDTQSEAPSGGNNAPDASASSEPGRPPIEQTGSTVVISSIMPALQGSSDSAATSMLRLAYLVPEGAEFGTSALPVEPLSMIGRTSDNQIQIEDRIVSRSHARITLTPEGYELEDLGSENGTYVNGDRIDKRALNDADRVQIGNVRFIFHLSLPA